MELWHSEFDERTKILYGIHTAGFYSCINCVRMSLYKLISRNIFPDKISFLKTLHLYRDSNDIDLYGALYQKDENLINQIGVNSSFEIFCPTNADHTNIIFNYTTPIERAYFYPSGRVSSKIEFLTKKYDINFSKTIAVLHRGTDKWKEAELLPISNWIDVIDDRIEDGDKIFIQTDDEHFLNGFLEYYGDRCFYITENVFGTDRNSNVVPVFNKTEWCVSFEAIMRIVSKCKKIINHTGNCALVPILYRGNLKGETQFFGKKIIDYDKIIK